MAGERRTLWAVAVVAAAAVAMAVPRLVAGALVALAPGVYADSRYPSAEQVGPTLRMLSLAQSWHVQAQAGAYQAVLLGLGDQPSEQRQVLRALLARSPLQPQHWLQLARLEAVTDPARALAAWRLSVFSARLDPAIMEDRLGLGLALKPRMTPSDLDLLDDQVRLAYVVRPAQVVRLLAQPDNAVHRAYVTAIVAKLSPADIDAMVRIHALH